MKKTPSLIILFGSGEQTPAGRAIFEDIFIRSAYTAPVSIGILETPTGFEVNAIHGWPERQQDFFEKHLSNYHPEVTRIRAWRKDGEHSSNDPAIADLVLRQDFLYSGAGSPSYVIRHLRGSRTLTNMRKAHQTGTVLCLGSATAVASGAFSLPVYEIFKVGNDPYWIKGLNIFGAFGLRLAIVPHWNNSEGEDFDSSRCWMGVKRFDVLRSLLPPDATVLGVDETTAVIFDFQDKTLSVLGLGNAHAIRGKKVIVLEKGKIYPISILT